MRRFATAILKDPYNQWTYFEGVVFHPCMLGYLKPKKIPTGSLPVGIGSIYKINGRRLADRAHRIWVGDQNLGSGRCCLSAALPALSPSAGWSRCCLLYTSP